MGRLAKSGHFYDACFNALTRWFIVRSCSTCNWHDVGIFVAEPDQTHGYAILFKMALVGDGHEEVYEEMIQSELKLFAMLAKKMQRVKDEIEEQNNDIHRISRS